VSLPTKADHCGKAAQNDFFVSTIGNPFWDWAVTGKFYAALHYVEAFLATKNPAVHSRNHALRDSNIQSDPVLRALYVDYRELESECHDARYDASLTFSQQDVERLERNLDRIRKTLAPLIA
jgi:hypothetical protein